MLKALIRKQMLEINRGFFYDYKKGKLRSKGNMIAFIVFYAFIMLGILGGTFGTIGYFMAKAFVPAGLGWLYFDIMILIAVVLGVFGTVFNTYSTLYMSKDNDLLLSMPIPVKNIMLSRLLGVYVMDILFSGVVLIPTLIMYYINAKPSFATIVGPVIIAILATVFVMILSIGLGWVVAKLSTKVKNKSFITAFLALAGIGLYYVVYFKATMAIQNLMYNIQDIVIEIRGAVWIPYIIGSVGEGNWLAVVIMTALVAALSVLVIMVLSRTFIKIVTTKTGAAKKVYKEKSAKVRSPQGAIFFKELKRFTASSTYMLNCGLGTVVMVLMAIVVALKGQGLLQSVLGLFSSRPSAIPVMIGGLMVMALSMNDISGASISLEGKDLWIYQSLPVTPLQVLKGKLAVHMAVTLIPALMLATSVVVVMGLSLPSALLVLVFTTAAAFFGGMFGLMMNLLKPNFSWTDETVAVKQSFSIFLVMFGGWVLGILVVASGLLLTKYVSGILLLVIWSILTIILDVLLFCWLKTKGCKIFSEF